MHYALYRDLRGKEKLLLGMTFNLFSAAIHIILYMWLFLWSG